MFDDLLDANRRYQETFAHGGLAARAARGLAVVTCIDSRIEPLAMLGLVPGDAKIIRNAGGRITDDALRSLILAVNLLGVDRVAVVQHTRCAMAQEGNDGLRARITELRGVDASGWDFGAIDDQQAVLAADVALVRACPLLPRGLVVEGFIYDVATGALETIVAS